jgi:tRNA nucleotidyltransferase (CCA-adding enzyme)
MQANRWEHFSHDADIGIRGIGATQEQAFEQVALAMTAVITNLAWVDAQEMVEIICEAPDPELLLVDWLNALVYEMATRHLLFSRFEVRVYGHQLQGRAWGEKVSVEKHQPAVEIKGATLTSLRVRRESNGVWVAQCVVDV